MNPVWAKFKELPAALQRRIAQRVGIGIAALALFGIIWAATGTFGLATPGLALAGYLLGSGGLLHYRCVRGEYIRLTGTVQNIITSGLRQRPKSLLIETEQGLLQLPSGRKPFPAGTSVTIYLASNTPVYEQDGLLKIYTYLALELASPPQKSIDETWKL